MLTSLKPSPIARVSFLPLDYCLTRSTAKAFYPGEDLKMITDSASMRMSFFKFAVDLCSRDSPIYNA